jgi:hypothetical protein
MASQETVKLLSFGREEGPGNCWPWPMALGNSFPGLLPFLGTIRLFPSKPYSKCIYILHVSVLLHVDIEVICGSNLSQTTTTVYVTTNQMSSSGIWSTKRAGMERTRKMIILLYTVNQLSFAATLFRDSFVINWLMTSNFRDRAFIILSGLLKISGSRQKSSRELREIFSLANKSWFTVYNVLT